MPEEAEEHKVGVYGRKMEGRYRETREGIKGRKERRKVRKDGIGKR